MSFQALFEELSRQLKQFNNDFNKKPEQLSTQLQRMISTNQKKLEIFLQKFQNQIAVLKKSQQRDSKMIDNLRYEVQQKRSQALLVENATKMEEILVQKLKQNIKSMQKISREISEKTARHSQSMNRNLIDIDQIENRQMNTGQSCIEINRRQNKLVLKIDKNGTNVYEIMYNKAEDKFGIANADKSLTHIVNEFNFHRNMNKLFNDLYQFS